MNSREKALKILNILSDHDYESYIVGGYVRDIILGIESNDIDICTSAPPKEIIKIFTSTTKSNYGSVKINYQNTYFDITTMRKDIKYKNNRTPAKVKYIKNIKKDLLRRDFTINTLCIDKNNQIKDYLNVKSDLDNKILRVVGNPRKKLKEDALRILRATRFTINLNLSIEKKTKRYLVKYAYLLKKISYDRKRQELDKIFTSPRKKEGIKLLTDLSLTTALDIPNLSNTTPCDDPLGIWSQLNVDNIYPFTKKEKDLMQKIRHLQEQDIYDKYNIYKYGLYISTIAYQIKEASINKLNQIYNTIPIHSKKDIKITKEEIIEIINKKPGKYLTKIINILEKEIVNGNIKNSNEELKKYIRNNKNMIY